MQHPQLTWYLYTMKQAYQNYKWEPLTHKKLNFNFLSRIKGLKLLNHVWKWRDTRITAVHGQFIFWSQSMSPVTLQQVSVICISINWRAAISETRPAIKAVVSANKFADTLQTLPFYSRILFKLSQQSTFKDKL